MNVDRQYNVVVDFIEANHRNPSCHRIEKHDHLNWLKANRKLLNAGRMKSERVETFRKLLELMEQYRRKNQYELWLCLEFRVSYGVLSKESELVRAESSECR